MKKTLRKLGLAFALFACGNAIYAQLPNEKFGKPSNQEWDYVGWGNASNADAIILCKTMNVTYEINDQFGNMAEGVNELNAESLQFLGNNRIDNSGILVNYDFKLRTKILKPEGAKHANIDITYYEGKDRTESNHDELTDIKIKVFSKNEKGKVVNKKINTSGFIKEHLDDNYVVLHVVVPDVEPGSIIEYQYTIRSPRPSFLYDWSFQECIPMVHSKCDINMPASIKFDMNTPINKLIKANVVADMITYDQNRTDMKGGKKCRTNHYTISGDYILPEGYPLKANQGDEKNNTQEKIASFTGKIKETAELPVYMPEGATSLRIK